MKLKCERTNVLFTTHVSMIVRGVGIQSFVNLYFFFLSSLETSNFKLQEANQSIPCQPTDVYNNEEKSNHPFLTVPPLFGSEILYGKWFFPLASIEMSMLWIDTIWSSLKNLNFQTHMVLGFFVFRGINCECWPAAAYAAGVNEIISKRNSMELY